MNPSMDEIRKYYDRDLGKQKQYYTLGSPRHRIMLRTVSRLVELFPSRKLRVLDIGCGAGNSIRQLILAGVAEPGNICGIELSPVLAEFARTNSGGVLVQELDITENLSPRSERDRFDIIILMDVYEHILPERRFQIWDNVSKALANRAVVYLAFPDGPGGNPQITDFQVEIGEVLSMVKPFELDLWSFEIVSLWRPCDYRVAVLQHGLVPKAPVPILSPLSRSGDGITQKTGTGVGLGV